MATRTGKVILAKGIKLDKSYNNVLSYTESQMVTLCTNNAVASFSNCSFLKPGENVIDVQTSYGVALQANYIAFQNPDYSYKWFFGFIDEVEYISNNNSRIHYTIDEFSTWWDYWNPKRCFIVREHTNDDTVGNNLIPENLELGEYVTNGEPNKMGQNIYYVVNADKDPATDIDGNPTNPSTTWWAGNIGGIPISGNLFVPPDVTRLYNMLLTYNRMTGGIDHVKNVYIVNSLCMSDDDLESGDCVLEDYYYERYRGRRTPKETTMTITPMGTLDGYTPRNNKLLSNPFQFLLMTNNNGSSNKLYYEFFANRNSMTIEAVGVPVIGSSAFAYPLNYKGTSKNYNEGIMAGKTPTLSWSGDAYTNWLTQNAVNIRNSVIGETATVAAGIGLGVITGGAGGAIIAGASLLSGAKSASQLLQEQKAHKEIPNSFNGNVNGGDVLTAGRDNAIYVWKMSITSEFAQVIDSYFDLYGYKTLKVKTPNQMGRTYWNYVQIGDGESIGLSVNSANTPCVPASSMDIINKIYQKGVTIWHSHDNIGNYQLNNTIV